MNGQEHEIAVVCFAGLRKFFDAETSTKVSVPCTYLDLLNQLGQEKPEAEKILRNCRIAIDEAFVPTNSPLDPAKKVFLIPPSSGG
ncbi:MAG TPA: MoaD/ThiS family protein [Sunxiuqinia sp.]|nr:MoaD/ThiS family protein [Sunxiuqinia sp.]